MEVVSVKPALQESQSCLHLEQADTGRETLSSGLSAKLERCFIMVMMAAAVVGVVCGG